MDAEIFSYHVYVYTYNVGKKAHRAMVQPPYASNACRLRCVMRCSPAMAHCIRCDVLLCGHMVVIWYCSEN